MASEPVGIVAVAGIGSNSTRMLVARVTDKGVEPIHRDIAFTRLFLGMDAAGNLSGPSMEKAIEALLSMREKAESCGAEAFHIFATSATRDAGNGAFFAEEIRRNLGISLDILTGREEARIGFLGAAGSGCAGLVDIGGGSTEVVTGTQGKVEHSVSMQLGAARLCREFEGQPKETLFHALPQRIAKGLDSFPVVAQEPRRDWTGIGGTLSIAAALTRGISWEDKARIHGTEVSKQEAFRWRDLLFSMTLAERQAHISIPPGRADVAPYGLSILAAVMEYLGLEKIRASIAGNLEGYLISRYLS